MSEAKKVIYQDSYGNILPDCFQSIPEDIANAKGSNSTRYIFVKSSSDNKALPELYSSSEFCCGCTACYSACPLSGADRNKYPIKKVKIWDGSQEGNTVDIELTGAISMLPDAEGFLYPVVDASICIRCYKCLNVCAFKRFNSEQVIREQNKYE